MRFAPPLQPATRLDPARRTGLLYLGLGGPDGQDAVEPFLRNLFADPMVLPIPRFLSGLVGRMIVARRVDEVRAKYRDLGFGGGSPQLDWTAKQAHLLAERLGAHGVGVTAAVAMRYWHPFTDEAVGKLRDAGVEQLLVVPTYPQYSVATTGSSLRELQRILDQTRWSPPMHVLREWPLLTGYVDLLARHGETVVRQWREQDRDPAACALVYTAHSLPERFDRGGDAYVRQTRATVTATHARLVRRVGDIFALDRLHTGGREPRLAFQSKVGPVKWIGPPTEDTCLALVAAGVRHLAVIPVSFNCEHIETIDELDRELGDEVRRAGIESFQRAPALNLDTVWLQSLVDRLLYRAFGLVDSPEVTHG